MELLNNTDRKFKKKVRIYSIAASTFIVTGFTSFSNHPSWGYWWSATGFVLLIVLLVIARKKKGHGKL